MPGDATQMGCLCIDTNLPHEVFKMASVRDFSVPSVAKPLQSCVSGVLLRVKGAYHDAWTAMRVAMGRGGFEHRVRCSHGIKQQQSSRSVARNLAGMVYVPTSDTGASHELLPVWLCFCFQGLQTLWNLPGRVRCHSAKPRGLPWDEKPLR